VIFEYIKPLEFFEDIEIENLSQMRLPNKKYGFLEINNNKLQIFTEEKLYNIKILKNDYSIKELANKNLKIVTYIKESIKDKFATINIYVFYFSKEFLELNISIDDKALENAKKQHIISNNQGTKELDEIFKQKSKIDINQNQYFILGVVHNDIDNFENESFLLYCDGYILAIKNSKIDEDMGELKITKIIQKKPQNENNLILLKTKITFGSDLISDRISNELQEVIKNENSYINVWNKFLDFEGEMLLDKARQTGAFEIQKIIPNKNELEIVLDKRPKNLKVNDSIGLFKTKPDYLEKDFNFKELEKKLAQENSIDKEIYFEIKQIKENSIFIESDNLQRLKEFKIVAYSIFGDKVQIERKLKAREFILTGKAANPFLGLILEKDAKPHNTNNITKIEPLSEFVEKKIFKNPPTQNQKEAISIALNTPDIAIIQGPPGTGKTTVITAIIERLNELKEKDNIKGRVLVVGYQHDAVTNLAQRLSINSLPAVKFGNKDIKGEYKKYQTMLKWADEIKQNAKQNLKNYSNQKLLNELETITNIYLQSPSNQTALNILEKLQTILPKRFNEFEEYKQKFKDDIFDIKELKEIYALRVTKEAFEDDGKERIEDLLNTNFIDILNKSEKNTLIQKDIKYIDDYKEIKIKLLEFFYPKPRYKKPKPNSEFIELLENVKEELEQGNTKSDKINKILFRYINELENNPFALFEMVKDYSFVFASSVQQSAREDINKEKDDEFYDVVIVDEAARVPPMDLFIPMVKGKKIILVGDHRQLPHLVEDKIVEEVASKDNIEEDLIRKSIFEYLINRAKELQEFDGIKRVITLNNQYRTNPIMGEFVNQNFYEKYNPDEKFDSPRKLEEFSHNLEGIENMPSVWIDVPNKLCSEAKDSSKSTYRECEAKKIVQYLKKWKLSDEGKDLEYGVISFYKAQVNLIKNLIKKELPQFANEIRVGSVDAFQGMEFDVVFLSATRSKKVEEMRNSSIRGLFGFLVSKNRLNVAMSRQKKVLIGVGDSAYFTSQKAKQYIPEIGNFIDLCKIEGKVL